MNAFLLLSCDTVEQAEIAARRVAKLLPNYRRVALERRAARPRQKRLRHRLNTAFPAPSRRAKAQKPAAQRSFLALGRCASASQTGRTKEAAPCFWCSPATGPAPKTAVNSKFLTQGTECPAPKTAIDEDEPKQPPVKDLGGG